MDPEFATAGPEPFCSSPSSIDGNKTESVLKGEEAFPLQLALFAPVLIPLASYAANTELPLSRAPHSICVDVFDLLETPGSAANIGNDHQLGHHPVFPG